MGLPLWDAVGGVPELQVTAEFCFYPEPSYFNISGSPDAFPPTPSTHTHTRLLEETFELLSPSPHLSAGTLKV